MVMQQCESVIDDDDDVGDDKDTYTPGYIMIMII